MLLTTFNILFLLVYLLSAAVQYNDPDALLWIAIYLAAAGMCIVQLSSRQARWLPPSLLVISLVWIGMLLPSIIGEVSLGEIVESISMKTREVEEAREIGGLLLVVIWAAVLTRTNGAAQ